MSQTCQELQPATCQTDATQQPVPAWNVLPHADIFENDVEYVVSVDLPGVTPDAVDISIEKDLLRISATAGFPVPEGYKPVSGDWGTRHYERQFRLSPHIDRDGIDAQVRNGVLTLKLAKARKAQRQSIPVRG